MSTPSPALPSTILLQLGQTINRILINPQTGAILQCLGPGSVPLPLTCPPTITVVNNSCEELCLVVCDLPALPGTGFSRQIPPGATVTSIDLQLPAGGAVTSRTAAFVAGCGHRKQSTCPITITPCHSYTVTVSCRCLFVQEAALQAGAPGSASFVTPGVVPGQCVICA